MFNHSSTSPNVDYRLDREQATVTFLAGKNISSGEELFIFYGEKSNLWFEDSNATEEDSEESSDSDNDDNDGASFLSRMAV